MFIVNKKIFEATKDKFFYGWVIVGIGSLGIFTSGAGQSHTFSPFIPVISQDLKISSTSITKCQTSTLGACARHKIIQEIIRLDWPGLTDCFY